MENQRIRLTKKMLKEALVRLLEHEPIEKITVYQLCSEAEINRTTFYKYYGSPSDLMNDIQSDFINELEKSLLEKDRPVSLQMILTYIDTHRESCKALLRSAFDNGFFEKIISLSLITQKLDEQTSPKYSGYKKEYVKEFVIYGTYSIISKWLRSEKAESPEKIAKLIFEIMEKI
jgi:AcrR family transcriptional regulator